MFCIIFACVSFHYFSAVLIMSVNYRRKKAEKRVWSLQIKKRKKCLNFLTSFAFKGNSVSKLFSDRQSHTFVWWMDYFLKFISSWLVFRGAVFLEPTAVHWAKSCLEANSEYFFQNVLAGVQNLRRTLWWIEIGYLGN